MSTVDDELHAAAVRHAVEQLNDAVSKAEEAGLAVTLHLTPIYITTRREPTALLSADVRRPI